jgi:hypothetical protein
VALQALAVGVSTPCPIRPLARDEHVSSERSCASLLIRIARIRRPGVPLVQRRRQVSGRSARSAWQTIRSGGPHRTPGANERELSFRQLVEVPLPVMGHLPGRSGSRLARGVMLGRRERRALGHLVRPIVVVPVLAGFEARDDPMTRAAGVSTRML